MANIESGKIFDIDISISKFISEYGSSTTVKQYCQWLVSQLASVLHIDESYFNLKDISKSRTSCFLPYINQQNEDTHYLYFSFYNEDGYLSEEIQDFSGLEISLMVYINNTKKSYIDFGRCIWAYENNNEIQIVNPEYSSFILKNQNSILRFDTRFLNTHNFYTINFIRYDSDMSIKKFYTAPNVIICDMLNNLNNKHFDGLIMNNEYESYYGIYTYCISQNSGGYYSEQEFKPQIFTEVGVKDSFTISKLYVGESKAFKDIYLLRTDMSDIINNYCSFEQRVETCKDGWDLNSFSDSYGEKYAIGLSYSNNDFRETNRNAFVIVTKGVPKCEPEPEPIKGYLKFSSDGNFTLSVFNPCWNGTIEYSIDNGKTWITWSGTQIAGNKNQDIYLRGSNNTRISGKADGTSSSWTFTGKYCTGNIETLLDYNKVMNGQHPSMLSYCYYRMFYGCTSLIEAPELPATELVDFCYYYMFYYCSSLVDAPKLPATELAYCCYQFMFFYCTSLVNAPKLPATKLADHCYNSMFDSCTSLVNAPELPATELAQGCYKSMFYGCKSLKISPKLSATTLADYCYTDMFYNCTSLAQISKLPATKLAKYCYYQMFYKTAIKLVTTQTDIYKYPFRIPENGIGIDAEKARNNFISSFTPSINTTYYTDHEPI